MGKIVQSICFAVMASLPWIASQAQNEGSTQILSPTVVRETVLEFRQFERVEITGSTILAKQVKEVLPVQVLSQRDIERSGKTSLPELLQQLPVMNNFPNNGTVASNFGGVESAALHGYAAGTLVLLNGKRLPNYGINTIASDQTFVDLNILPLSAIERIEILTDGASTRYGSDAVAGVINIITKSSVQGATLNTQWTQPAGGKAQGQLFNWSWGRGKTAVDGYSLQAHVSLEKQNPLLAGDRMVAREGAIPLDIQGQRWWNLGFNLTAHGWPASVLSPQGQVTSPTLAMTGQCPADWYTMTDAQRMFCMRNAQPGLTLYPGMQKQQVFLSGEAMLSNQWLTFGQLLLGKHVQDLTSKDSYDIQLPLANGDSALTTTQPLGPITQAYTNRSYQGTWGLRGQVDDWDISGSVSVGEHRVVRQYTRGLISGSILRALGSSGLTLADLSQDLSQLSEATLAKFSPYVQTQPRLLDEGYTQLNTLDLLASRELFETNHGPVALGLGVNWREERIAYQSNPALAGADRPSFQSQRNNAAVHTELQWPVSEFHELTASLRHDHYSDFGDVQTGKLGWRWRPSKEFMVRASVGTGFKAPAMAQMLPLSTNLGVINDPVNGQQLSVRYAGNPNLQPERSLQSSLGLRWEPSGSWTFGADLWQLSIRDYSRTLSPEVLLIDPALRAKYLTPTDSGSYLLVENLNLGRVVKQGLDYDVQWRSVMDAGRVWAALKGSLTLQALQQSDPLSNFDSSLGKWNPNIASYTPRHQFTLAAGLDQADWSVSSALNYRSGNTEVAYLANLVNDKSLDLARTVPGFWTLDLGGRWQATKQWLLSGRIANVTDRYPALRMEASGILLGVDTRYANYYGRTFSLKAQYKF